LSAEAKQQIEADLPRFLAAVRHLDGVMRTQFALHVKAGRLNGAGLNGQ
jgi:hypothetical protein